MGSLDLSMTMGPPHPGDTLPDHTSPARPSLAFPLGTGLLLLVIFTLSVVFSCCYHWDKLQSFFRSSSTAAAGGELALPVRDNGGRAMVPGSGGSERSDKLLSKDQDGKQGRGQSLPVLMPGDKVPKFMAWPCPCQKDTQEMTMENQSGGPILQLETFMVEVVVSTLPTINTST